MGKDRTRPRDQEERCGQRGVVSVGGRDRDAERFFEDRVEQGETKRNGGHDAYPVCPRRKLL